MNVTVLCFVELLEGLMWAPGLTTVTMGGNTLLAGADKDVLAFARAFASGAVLASVADTVMPDAYQQGGPLVAFATAAGFLLTFVLTQG